MLSSHLMTLRHLIWGALRLDTLKELVYEAGLLREGVCQIGDLLGQMVFTI